MNYVTIAQYHEVMLARSYLLLHWQRLIRNAFIMNEIFYEQGEFWCAKAAYEESQEEKNSFKHALISTHLHCKYETKADLDVKKISCRAEHFLNILLSHFLCPHRNTHSNDPAEKFEKERRRERFSLIFHTIYLFLKIDFIRNIFEIFSWM